MCQEFNVLYHFHLITYTYIYISHCVFVCYLCEKLPHFFAYIHSIVVVCVAKSFSDHQHKSFRPLFPPTWKWPFPLPFIRDHLLLFIYLLSKELTLVKRCKRHVSGEMEEGGEFGGGIPRRYNARGRGIAGLASGAGGRVLGWLPVPEMPGESGWDYGQNEWYVTQLLWFNSSASFLLFAVAPSQEAVPATAGLVVHG